MKERIFPIQIQPMDIPSNEKYYKEQLDKTQNEQEKVKCDQENPLYKLPKPQLEFDVGDIIRMFIGTRYRVWKITGIHLGGLGQESLVSLIPLDIKQGCAFGKTEDCVMPYDLLITNPCIKKV